MSTNLVIDIAQGIAIIISLFVAFSADKKASGGIEIELYRVILDARRYLADSAGDLQVLSGRNSANEKALLEVKKQKYNLAKQELLNSYEQACSKYLDKKIDKKRFQKHYKEEIANIVKGEDFKEYYNQPATPYKATLKVYNEWNNLE